MTLLRRLVGGMLVAVLSIGAVSILFIWLQTYLAAQQRLDRELEQRAAQLLAQPLPDAAMPAPNAGPGAQGFVIQVWNDGQPVYQSDPQRSLPRAEPGAVRRLRFDGSDWRVVALAAGTRVVQVAQTMKLENLRATTAAFNAVLPLAAAVPVLALLIAWTLRRAMLPLNRLAELVQGRAPLSAKPLPLEQVPGELRPLMKAFDLQLQRSQAVLAREHAFIADAAHALRTPLGALQLQAEVLAEAGTEQDRAQRMDELRTGIARVVRLSGQLLNLARSQVLSTTPVATSFAGMFEAILSSHGSLMAERRLSLSARLEPGAEDTQLRITAADAQIVLANLLDNAIRHSPAGATVELAGGRSGNRAWIEIRDEGPGLPAEELEAVLQRFYRVRGDPTEGTGLGLSIVRLLVERVGGQVRLSNRNGRSGLVARVELPEADGEAQAAG
ncbi:MAG TPA: ATP-binding protein [Nevskia sp.]|nr:ATP-binding protein [Nevskia sp.]